MKKEWTVRDGVVGTHHINREGKSVDFRPAKIVAGQDFINVEPPKGARGGEGCNPHPYAGGEGGCRR